MSFEQDARGLSDFDLVAKYVVLLALSTDTRVHARTRSAADRKVAVAQQVMRERIRNCGRDEYARLQALLSGEPDYVIYAAWAAGIAAAWCADV